MMEQIELQAEQRKITGKKVGRLRRAGMVPAILYGHSVDPRPLQVPTQVLTRVLRQAGGNRLISLRIDGGKPRMVLAKEVQRHPTSQAVLHADFQEVVMTERIVAELPIELVGESPAIAGGLGLLIQGMDRLEIQCLPGDLPPAVLIDLSQLKELDQAIHVRDLSLGDDVDILSDPDEMIVTLLRPRRPEDEEEVVEFEEAVEGVAEPEVLSAQRRAERGAVRETEEPEEEGD